MSTICIDKFFDNVIDVKKWMTRCPGRPRRHPTPVCKETTLPRAATLSEQATGRSFTQTDRAAVIAWAERHRQHGVAATIRLDRDALLEVIEIGLPVSNVPKWCIWRDLDSRMRVDRWHTWKPGMSFAGLPEALGFVAREVVALLYPADRPGGAPGVSGS